MKMQRDDAWVSNKISNFKAFIREACKGLPAEAKGDLQLLDLAPDSLVLGYFGRLSNENCTVDEFMTIAQKHIRLELFRKEDLEKFRKYVELFLEITRPAKNYAGMI